MKNTKQPASTTQKSIKPVRQKSEAFKHTMMQARSHMSVSQRIFSKVIHIRSIELISDALGRSLFRPTVIITGSLCALIFSSVMYLVAKHYGYELAGSEFLVAFVFGWLVGIILDYISLLLRSITKKRRKY